MSAPFPYGSDLGIFETLSLAYYVAVAITLIAVALAVIDKRTGRYLPLLGLLALVAELYFTPDLIVGFSSNYASYLTNTHCYTISSQILQDSSINSVYPSPCNWPGVWLFFATFLEVLGIQNLVLSTIVAQWLTVVLMVFLFFGIMTQLFGDKRRLVYISTLIAIFGVWTFPSIAINDVSFSIVLFLVLLLIIGKAQKGAPWLALAGSIVLIALAISNPYASASAVGLLLLSSAFFLKRKKIFVLTLLFLIAFISFFLWYVIINPNIVSGYSPQIERLFSLHFLTSELTAKVTGSLNHQITVFNGELLTIFFALLAFSGLILRRRKLTSQPDLQVLLGVVGIVLVVVSFGPAYGLGSSIMYSVVETIQRAWVFAFFGVAFYATQLFVGKKSFIFLIVILLLFTPLFVVARYGNVGFQYSSPPVMYGGIFFTDYTYSNVVIQETANFSSHGALYIRDLRYSSIPSLPFQGLDNITFNLTSQSPAFIFVSFNTQGAALNAALSGDKESYYTSQQNFQNSNSSFNLVYTNPQFSLFESTTPISSSGTQ